MSEGVYKENSLRMPAFKKLSAFLANPGRFCLIVLGKRGTGKHFSIKKAFEQITQNLEPNDKKDLCLKELNFLEHSDIPEKANMMDKFFEKYDYHTVVIEDIENLNDEQQKILFDFLTTKDGATFGIKEKKYKLRLVFTSSKDSDTLRQDGEKLQGYFWDRISQLVVVMPSYTDDKQYIKDDFDCTWNNMQFQKTKKYEHLSHIPRNATLEKLIDDFADKFEGGFRDLDKLACMYFNYRIFYYGCKKKILEELEETEKKIVDNIEDDFFSKTQLLGNYENDTAIFHFERGKDAKKLLKAYKVQLKKWATKEYKGVGKAEKALGAGKGTFKNYK
jgi:hypothetical protein